MHLYIKRKGGTGQQLCLKSADVKGFQNFIHKSYIKSYMFYYGVTNFKSWFASAQGIHGPCEPKFLKTGHPFDVTLNIRWPNLKISTLSKQRPNLDSHKLSSIVSLS